MNARAERRTTFIVVALSALVPAALLFRIDTEFGPDWPLHTVTLSYFGEFVRHHGMVPSTINTDALLGGANPVFYGVLFYPLVGLAAAAVGANIAVRLAAIGAIVLQTWQVYKTARVLSGDRWLAYTLVAAANASIFALSDLYDRGDLTEFTGVALLTAAVAAWLRAARSGRPLPVYLQAALFLALAVTAHPIVALLGVPVSIIVALLALPKSRRVVAQGAAIVGAIALIALSPWLYAYTRYHPFLQTASLFSSGPKYAPGVDTLWSLFHGTPYVGPGANLDIDAQLNMILLIVVLWLGVEAVRLRRRIVPAASAVALGLVIGLYSALPALGAAVHILGTIQFAYRLVAYADLFFVVAALLLAAELRGASSRRYAAVFAVVALVATSNVAVKLTRAAGHPVIGAAPGTFANRDVIHEAKEIGAVYGVAVHAPDDVTTWTPVALRAGTGPQYGEPLPGQVQAARGTVVLVKNVQSFPWNHLVVDGHELTAAQEVVITPPRVAGFTNVRVALGFHAAGGTQTVELSTQPDALWLALRFISFWSIFAVAGALAWAYRRR